MTRLNRNKERRFAREKQKGIGRASIADSEEAGTPSKSGGTTTRKCANCGMVGHIKTNKKYFSLHWTYTYVDIAANHFFTASTRLCPKLNGSAPPDDAMSETAFSMAAGSTSF